MNRLMKRIIDRATRKMIQDKGVDSFMEQYIRIIDKYNKEEGSNYKTTEEEVDDVIKGVPELKPVREQLIKLTRNARIKAGLGE
jgi:hypothetical protein